MSREKSVKQKGYFFIRHDYRNYRIDCASILYVEARRVYCRIVTAEKSWMVLMSMNDLEVILPEGEFCRVHRSYIVSLAHIEWFDRKHVKVPEREIPIGNLYEARLRREIVLLPAEAEKANGKAKKPALVKGRKVLAM